jgi:predicted ATPase
MVRHNLPAAATPFVGREQELESLAEFIADPEERIITLVGPGGIGKTRLALEAARRELHPLPHFPDGIFFVSLAPVDSVAQIVATLAAMLDFHFQVTESGSRTEAQQILDYLERKQMLLIMDNFEHILDGRSFLMEISAQAAAVKLLVTSRERLQLRGEQRFPLHGLEMPQTRDSAVEALADYAAARLFMNISRRTDPDFKLLEGDAEQLLRICRLVEGMPLGLELAASWVGLLSLSDIAAEIEKSLDILATEHHDVPERHRNMQATLDASWRNLNSDQQLGFQELTVFRGGFTRSAAFEVTGVTLPLLVTLTNKSWLSYDRQSDRYNIHELLRQFGAAKLNADSVHEQKVRERHSAYFCNYLKEREVDWLGARQKEVASEMQDEIENIQRAWRWAANQGNVSLLSQGLNSLCRYYYWEGRITDGQKACRSAGERLSKSIAEGQTDDPQGLTFWSNLIIWEAGFISEIEQKEKLLAFSQRLLDRVAKTGWDTRREQASLYLGEAYAVGDKDYEEAIRFAILGLELYRELGDRWGEAECLGFVGGKYNFQGAFDRAQDLLRESLEIRMQLEDTQRIAETTINLGLVAQHQGRYQEAESLHQQGLRLYKQLGTQFYESLGLIALSFTQSWAGNFFAARETAKLSSELERDLGNVSNLWNHIALTLATIHLGRYNETMAMATEGLEIAKQRGHLTEKGFALMFLGNIAFVDGDLAKAVDYLLKSVSLFAELRYVYQALPRSNLSHVIRSQGDHQLARDHLESALRSGIEFRSMTPIMYCLPVAALLTADEGRPERAIELYGLAQQFGHITHSRWFEEVACRELEEVRASLPPEVAMAAEARGRELDLWSTADDLLNELKSLGHADG